MMKYDLTINKIKNTNFASLYDRFIIGEELSSKQYETLLAIAICFLNADDTNVQQLGYRIIVDYCNQTKNYIPLYEIAINKGLYPISKFIESNYVNDVNRNFYTEWNDAFTEQYKTGDIYQSEQQKLLVEFFSDKINDTVSVIAPTSYGKSELIISAINMYSGKNVCILTSTKALLTQTKKRIQDSEITGFSKIIVHPEMYNPTDASCLAVLTQERLLRLYKKDAHLKFDCIIVDEAHEILEENSRSNTLANVIIVSQKRNPNVVFKFLTPFLHDADNLKVRYTTYNIESFKVNEYIKTEKYFIFDLKNDFTFNFYDQFFDKFIPVSLSNNEMYEEKIVQKYGGKKNIIYLNKPTDIEKFALALADVLPEIQSDKIDYASENISNYLQPQYNLLKCLRKGVIYHHGSVPDAIRGYIEKLYKEEDKIKYVITSSTLLSGVNLPAEKMFILDNRKGKGYLTPEAFKNLIGRVCRFSEIFHKKNGDLQQLEPEVFILNGKYFSNRANIQNFLTKTAKVGKNKLDTVKNLLLTKTEINLENKDKFEKTVEFIENYENGVIPNYQKRYIQTDIGKACIMNGINELDLFNHEFNMQSQIEVHKRTNDVIVDTTEMLEVIYRWFIKYLPENGDAVLKRFEHQETRRFYAMLFDWRIKNKSYSEMITLFVGYWQQLIKNDSDVLVYVGKWGDTVRDEGRTPHYTKIAEKSRTELINLAIVRIKEEQDFMDNTIMKFVEVLQDLGFLEDHFYAKIKYGTDNENAICLIKNGLSLTSSLLLLNHYNDYLEIDIDSSLIRIQSTLVDEMKRNNENQIIVHEVQYIL